jgi:hypothetical protein
MTDVSSRPPSAHPPHPLQVLVFSNGKPADFTRFNVKAVTATRIMGALERFNVEPAPTSLELRVVTTSSETNFSSASSSTAIAAYRLLAAATPAISSFSPASSMPFSSTTLNLQWSLATDIGKAYVAGSSSILLQTDPSAPAFECKVSKVAFTLKSVNRYDESLACTLPVSLPASFYTIWVCVPGFGCGASAIQLNVLLGANNVAPAVGGTGGDVLVTITGNGERLPAGEGQGAVITSVCGLLLCPCLAGLRRTLYSAGCGAVSKGHHTTAKQLPGPPPCHPASHPRSWFQPPKAICTKCLVPSSHPAALRPNPQALPASPPT